MMNEQDLHDIDLLAAELKIEILQLSRVIENEKRFRGGNLDADRDLQVAQSKLNSAWFKWVIIDGMINKK